MSCSAWNKWSAKVLQCPFPKKETAQDCSIKHFQIKSIPFRPMPFHPYFMQILLSPHVIISSYCSQWLGHMIFTCKSVQPSHVNQYNQNIRHLVYPHWLKIIIMHGDEPAGHQFNSRYCLLLPHHTFLFRRLLLLCGTKICPCDSSPHYHASLWVRCQPVLWVRCQPVLWVRCQPVLWVVSASFVGEMSAHFVGGMSACFVGFGLFCGWDVSLFCGWDLACFVSDMSACFVGNMSACFVDEISALSWTRC